MYLTNIFSYSVMYRDARTDKQCEHAQGAVM